MNSVLVMGRTHMSASTTRATKRSTSGSLNHEIPVPRKGLDFPDGTTLRVRAWCWRTALPVKKRGEEPRPRDRRDGIKDVTPSPTSSALTGGVIEAATTRTALVLRGEPSTWAFFDPPACCSEQAKWNEIPTAAELAGLDGAPAADGGR